MEISKFPMINKIDILFSSIPHVMFVGWDKAILLHYTKFCSLQLFLNMNVISLFLVDCNNFYFLLLYYSSFSNDFMILTYVNRGNMCILSYSITLLLISTTFKQIKSHVQINFSYISLFLITDQLLLLSTKANMNILIHCHFNIIYSHVEMLVFAPIFQ